MKIMGWEPINRSELCMKSGFGILTSEHCARSDCWEMTAFLNSGMKGILKHRCQSGSHLFFTSGCKLWNRLASGRISHCWDLTRLPGLLYVFQPLISTMVPFLWWPPLPSPPLPTKGQKIEKLFLSEIPPKASFMQMGNLIRKTVSLYMLI